MEIRGKLNVFVKKAKAQKGEEVTYLSTSVGNNEGTKDKPKYINAYLDVILAGDLKGKESKLDDKHYYVLEVSKGFMSARTRKPTKGDSYVTPVIVVSEAKIEKKVVLKEKETF